MKWLRRIFGPGRTKPAPRTPAAPPIDEDAGVFPATWDERIALAAASPDNAHIDRVPEAGQVVDHAMVMHNGVRVGLDSYYGADLMRLVANNRGVHEPQEERVFGLLLDFFARSPQPRVMMELGSYWCFYSLTFLRHLGPLARCCCVEPDASNLDHGRANFVLNGITPEPPRVRFCRAFIDCADSSAPDQPPSRCVDSLAQEWALDHLDVLHSDIQGAEHRMLLGAQGMLKRRAIDYVFVSTHSTRLHRECLHTLSNQSYLTLAEAAPAHSYSFDGLIFARRAELAGLEPIEISQRPDPRLNANK
jgi:hypothetical protein